MKPRTAYEARMDTALKKITDMLAVDNMQPADAIKLCAVIIGFSLSQLPPKTEAEALREAVEIIEDERDKFRIH